MNDFTNFFKNLDETIQKLTTKFTNINLVELEQIIKILQETPTIEEIKKCVTQMQKINDELFQKEGISDEIIEFQISINKIRNYKDIVDEKEIIQRTNDGNFVQ